MINARNIEAQLSKRADELECELATELCSDEPDAFRVAQTKVDLKDTAQLLRQRRTRQGKGSGVPRTPAPVPPGRARGAI